MQFLRIIPTLASVLLTGILCAQEPGVLRGKVNFIGTPPEPEPLAIRGDRFCQQAAADQPILREDVVVNPNGTLANVVVWLSRGRPESRPSRSLKNTPASLTQTGCKFYPHVIAVQVNQPLTLTNQDGTLHNINILPKTNKRFNKVLLEDSKPETVTFTHAEAPLRVRCDIHPWMHAWVAIFDHSDFAVTAEDGTFEIPNLPPGEYLAHAWHEKYGEVQSEVLVFQEKPAEILFEFATTGAKSATVISTTPPAETETTATESLTTSPK